MNGVPPQVIEIGGGEFDGTQLFFTCDSSGSDIYRLFNPDFFIDGFGFFDRTTTFTPSRHTPRVLCIGDRWGSTGTALFEFRQGGVLVDILSASYDEADRMANKELVSVPFGTFDAFKAQVSFEVSGVAGGEPFVLTSTQTAWIVLGLGAVRSEGTEEVVTDVFELVDTNRTPVPELSSRALAMAALLMTAGLAMRVRGLR